MLCQCRDTEDFTKPQKADQFFDNLTYSKAIKRLKNEVVFEFLKQYPNFEVEDHAQPPVS